MKEILHQLIGSLSHYLWGFIHPRWLAGFLPSTVCHIDSTTHLSSQVRPKKCNCKRHSVSSKESWSRWRFIQLTPQKINGWNLRIRAPWKRNIIFQIIIFRFQLLIFGSVNWFLFGSRWFGILGANYVSFREYKSSPKSTNGKLVLFGAQKSTVGRWFISFCWGLFSGANC